MSRSKPLDPIAHLAERRGLTVEHLKGFGVVAATRGYEYPVDDPDVDGHVRHKRGGWTQAGPKYAWKPSGVKAAGLVYNLTRAASKMDRDGGLYVVAGEPDVWAMDFAGLPAVSFLAGEGTTPDVEAAAKLYRAGVREVIIIYDADDAGRKGALQVARVLAGAQIVAKVADIGPLAPRNAKGFDVGDLWAQWGADAGASERQQEFEDAVDSLTTTETVNPKAFIRVSGRELIKMKLEREALIGDGILYRQDSSLILSAPAKTHKSWWVLNLATHLAAGIDFLGWGIDQPRKVLYFALENGLFVTQGRLEVLWTSHDDLAKGIDSLTIDYMNSPLRLDHDIEAFERELDEVRPDVFILDTLRASHLAEENDAGQMVEVLQRIQTLAMCYGCAPIVIHHTRKGKIELDKPDEAMRGSSVIGAFFTTFMTMRAENPEITELTIAMKGRDLDQPEKVACTYDPSDRRFRVSMRDPDTKWEQAAADAERLVARDDKIEKGKGIARGLLKKAEAKGDGIAAKAITMTLRGAGLSVREADDVLIAMENVDKEIISYGTGSKPKMFALRGEAS